MYNNKRHFTKSIFLTRKSTLILKVSVLYAWLGIKKTLFHSVAVIILTLYPACFKSYINNVLKC